MERRFFTVREANDLIPFLTDHLCQLRSVHARVCALSSQVTPTLQQTMSTGGMPVDFHYFHLVSRVQSLVRKIGLEGVHVKDLEKGLVDFPTLLEGREIFLCWKLGEHEVGFWHEIDAGFAGRQPLNTRV